jgi:hypothetical protein
MLTETETKSTEQILVDMLTENTGRHFLDSGGAYGRNWERNAGKTVEDFMAAPEVEVVTWERNGQTVVEYVNLDVFHFLRQRLDYDAELDAAFHEFAMNDEHREDDWFTCLEAWFAAEGLDTPGVVNTYNGEDNLSQVIQYYIFEYEDEPKIALMIHGGCDVRGGYTAPRFFNGDDYTLYDNADLEVFMAEPEPVVLEGQDALFEVPERADRSLCIAIRGGYADRNPEPWDDKTLDAIDFSFGETPVTIEDGIYTVADGPAQGWTVSFHAPYPSC